MLRQSRILLLSLLALLCLTGGALAAEHDGYIIRLEPGPSLLSDGQSLPEGVEEIRGDQRLYKTADETLIAELEAAGLLAYAEPDYPAYLLELPDDPMLDSQWDLTMIGMERVWERGLTGEQADGTAVRVGIIDSGLYAGHEDLADSRVLRGVNLLAEEGTDDRYDTSDSVGHGTFIAGTIAAAADNGAGIAGIAPGAELLPLKCFDSTKGNVSDIVEAIYAGTDAGCRVLNMSFGVEEAYAGQALAEAIAYAAEEDVILVAAVGNSSSGGTGGDPLLYPAAYEEVIGVGAVDGEKEISYFSHRNSSVCVTAPGEALCGLDISAPDDYKTGKGTSFAAPEVAAAAALALSVDPELTPEEFGALLRLSSEDLGEAGYDTVYGHGLLNIAALLELLENSCCAVKTDGETEIVIRAAGLVPGSDLRAVRVICDETGRQDSLRLFPLTAGEDGTLKDRVAVPAQAEGRVSVLLLDENWRPVLSGWSSVFREPSPEEMPSLPLPEGTAEKAEEGAAGETPEEPSGPDSGGPEAVLLVPSV